MRGKGAGEFEMDRCKVGDDRLFAILLWAHGFLLLRFLDRGGKLGLTLQNGCDTISVHVKSFLYIDYT